MRTLFVILMIILQMPATAEANILFALNGLSFPCKSCKLLSGGICQLISNEKLAVTSCKELFSQLLDQELEKNQTSLSELSLLKGLLAADIDKKDSSKILKLLLSKSNTELKHFKQYTQALIANYPLTKKLIAKNNLSSKQVDKLVKIISISPNRELQMLMPLVINYYNRWTVDFLLNSLSSRSVDQDLDKLNLYQQSIKRNSLGKLESLSAMIGKLNSCALVKDRERLDCINLLRGSRFARYIEKLYFHEVLRFAQSNKLSVKSSFKILSNTAYEEFANENLYRYVYDHLSLHKGSLDFEIETRKMLGFLAIYHEGIAAELSKKNNSDSPLHKSIIYLPLLLILSLLLLKHLFSINENAGIASSELQQLMQFFDLPAWASKKDLKKKYREKIKNLHPDAGQAKSNDEDFGLACKNYKRACLLMEQP